ncbi:MAG TPA: hypothetical protein VGS58_13235 [Candidatus Sulfopaludibacter sp.]|nr:hypothetical protein [Candidatus Sulfopaludibacter sp.]
MSLRLIVRVSSQRLRAASSFGTSGAIHAALLGWLVWSAGVQDLPRPKTIYEMEIQPYEKHLIWYNLRDKLPDVKPAVTTPDRQPPRARKRFDQSIVAGKKDDTRPPQLIVMPAPAIELPKPLLLPNALAVTAPTPVRTFLPPAEVSRPTAAAATLPEAPRLDPAKASAAPDLSAAAARPVRPFIAPAEPKAPLWPPRRHPWRKRRE